jgi:hypothetical protein
MFEHHPSLSLFLGPLGGFIGLVIGVHLEWSGYVGISVMVGILVGFAIAEVLGRLIDWRDPPPTDERPWAAQARLDEAELAITVGVYRAAFSYLRDESRAAVRRRDADSLRVMLDQARRVEAAPDAKPRIKDAARHLAELLEDSLAQLGENLPSTQTGVEGS